jgi:REP element-mobilizing transposase RayT
MSFWRNYYHLVWKTHQRASLLVPSIESELYIFIIDQAAKIEVDIYAISSTEDHLHLVAAIPPELSVSRVVEDLKCTSENYINDLLPPDHTKSAWQQGYGCMTFGEGQLADVVTYVKSQSLLHIDNQTNAWLERAETRSEGPIDPGLSPKIAALLHESQSDYDIDMGEPPF